MEELSALTSQLKEFLSNVDEYKKKEKIIFKHIEAAEQLKFIVDDFPPDLDWFNTSEPLSSSHLQGKIVVLDFFTYCCINCLHILPNLRELEKTHSVADGLVVIGVHSAKFDNEKDSQNILLALKKYNICHPVVNDKDCHLWNKLGVSCWPTLLILGPQRQLVFALLGEGHKDGLLLFVKVALKFYEKLISSHELPLNHCDRIITSSFLSFPGKIAKINGLFAISDSGNHRVIVFDGNGHVKFKIGGKAQGFKDGTFETAQFNSPQGLAFCNSKRLYIADTENHAIRLIDLESLKVTTVVGNGRQGIDFSGGRSGALQEISSPWDVCVVPCSDVELPQAPGYGWSLPLLLPKSLSGNLSVPPPPIGSVPPPPPIGGVPPPPPIGGVPPPPPIGGIPPPPPIGGVPPPPPIGGVPPPPNQVGDAPSFINNLKNPPSKVLLIAAAGTHQIWAYFIESGVWWKGKKYEEGICVAVAGTGKEENRNNRYPMMASFAQPSGLAYSKELKSVFVADSESSSIRRLSLKDGAVSHVVGGGKSPNDLFSYGDVDGKGHEAKLQHPLGVAWNSKRNSLYVCDSYNHKIKEVDVSQGQCLSVPGGDSFGEPSGCCFDDSEDALYVCDTNNNCIKMMTLLDGSVKKLEIKEPQEGFAEAPPKDVWEEKTSLAKTGGTLLLKIEFSPKEIHGKWSLDVDQSKVKVETSFGKLTTRSVDFNFQLQPSDVEDVLKFSFDLVLCGNETCAFKKSVLKLLVKRTEAAGQNVVCHITKNLS